MSSHAFAIAIINITPTNAAILGDATYFLRKKNSATPKAFKPITKWATLSYVYLNLCFKQEDRLKSVGWLKSKITSEGRCPICSTEYHEDNSAMNKLLEIMGDFERITEGVKLVPSKLDVERLDIQKELREKEADLASLREQRQSLEDASIDHARKRQQIRQIYLFAGRIEQALENIETGKKIDDLQSKLNDLSKQIQLLKQILDPKELANRRNASIDLVSKIIEKYATFLELEHVNENVKLNIKDLTVEFKNVSGRTDYLWEVGSGQNWVGYHIATLLALHEYFSSIKNNSVPSFLVIDQPSQVYFPESSWTTIDIQPEHSKNKVSTDIIGVQRIFSALSKFMANMNNKFQIIVTEHAGNITWKDLDHINLVGNWREGVDEFLIPKSWE